MTDLYTAAKLALEHAKRDERHASHAETRYWCRMYRDIAENAIKALAEQPAQQEPVAWGVDWGKAGDISCVSIVKRLPDGRIEVVAVEYAPYSHTSPPAQRTWVGLTDEQKCELVEMTDSDPQPHHLRELIDVTEAKLKEKNSDFKVPETYRL